MWEPFSTSPHYWADYQHAFRKTGQEEKKRKYRQIPPWRSKPQPPSLSAPLSASLSLSLSLSLSHSLGQNNNELTGAGLNSSSSSSSSKRRIMTWTFPAQRQSRPITGLHPPEPSHIPAPHSHRGGGGGGGGGGGPASTQASSSTATVFKGGHRHSDESLKGEFTQKWNFTHSLLTTVPMGGGWSVWVHKAL